MNGDYKLSTYDRQLAGLDGVPDVVHTKPSTVRTVSFIGQAETFIVTTYRHREKGDTIALEGMTGEGTIRILLPPAVADAISRQRDALTAKVRSNVGKASAEARNQSELTQRLRDRAVRYADDHYVNPTAMQVTHIYNAMLIGASVFSELAIEDEMRRTDEASGPKCFDCSFDHDLYECESCGKSFCWEHGQKGGDRQVQDVGAVAYPSLCDDCRNRR